MADRGILFVLFLTLALVAYLILFHRFCLASPHDGYQVSGYGPGGTEPRAVGFQRDESEDIDRESRFSIYHAAAFF